MGIMVNAGLTAPARGHDPSFLGMGGAIPAARTALKAAALDMRKALLGAGPFRGGLKAISRFRIKPNGGSGKFSVELLPPFRVKWRTRAKLPEGDTP